MNVKPRYRTRGLMTEETFSNVLKWVKAFPPKDILALHVFGEPLLHPKFDLYALELSKLCMVTFSTNATYLNESWADRLSQIPFEWISVSNWDKSAKERAAGLLIQRNIPVRYPPNDPTHDWASQSSGGPHKVKMEYGCEFLREGKAVIRWNGDIATCCISDRAEDVWGNVSMEPGSVSIGSYDLCEKCHLNKGG